MKRFAIDNREAIAYVVFKYTGTDRDRALAIVAEFAELVPALTKILNRAWRSPRRKKATP